MTLSTCFRCWKYVDFFSFFIYILWKHFSPGESHGFGFELTAAEYILREHQEVFHLSHIYTSIIQTDMYLLHNNTKYSMHTVHTYTYMHTHSHINTYIYIRCLHAYYTHSKKIHAMFFIFILFPLFGFLRTFIELLHAGIEGFDITKKRESRYGWSKTSQQTHPQLGLERNTCMENVPDSPKKLACFGG